MDRIKVGINGFGRIGRCTFKLMLEDERIEVVGVNDLAPVDDMAYLLKYDSVFGWYPRKVANTADALIVDGVSIPYFGIADPTQLPWGDVGADIVIEATGAFRDRAKAAGHLEGGAKKVIISAPSDNADATFVLGVNEDTYDPTNHHVVSNASCTTNCVAPVVKVLLDRFGLEHVMMTTVHAYTSSQALVDTPTRHRRRGRAAAVSIIPTTTGAAKAVARVVPEVEGKMDAMAMRVPVPDGSISDIVATLSTETTVDEVNAAFDDAAAGRMAGYLRVADEELVSRDIIGDPHSSIVDRALTRVLDGRVVKVLSWYDNEWGYSARLRDLSKFIADKGL